MKLLNKFILIIGFTTLIVTGFTILLTYRRIDTTYRTSFQNEQLASLIQLSDTIDRFIFERYQDIRFFNIISRQKQLLADPDNLILAQDFKASLQHYLSLSFWEEVSIVDVQGKIILSTNSLEEGINIFDEDENLVAALKSSLSGEITNTDFFVSQNNKKSIMVFFSPIYDNSNSNIIGFIKANLPWVAVEQVLYNTKNNFVYILNSKGELIGSNKNIFESLYGKIEVNQWVDYSHHPVFLKTLDQAENSLTINSILGNYSTVSSFTHQKGYYDYYGNGWVLVTETPASVISSQVRDTNIRVSLVVIFIITITILIIFIILYRLVLKPVNNLILTSKKIIAGDLSFRASVESKDEMGTLGKSFNDLTNKLIEANSSLEGKINKRTEEMEQQNTRLEETKKAILNLLEDIEVEKENILKRQAQDEALLSSIGESVIAVDREAKVIFINKAAESFFKIKSGEVIGKYYYSLFDILDSKQNILSADQRPLIKVLSTGKLIEDNSFSVVLSDKTKYQIGEVVTPISKDKEIIGAVGVFRDITKEREIDKMKTEFVSVASHQLRTPLTAIRWYLEELFNGELGKMPVNQKEYIQQIIESNQRMIKLVNDLLNVSRLETGRINIVPEPTDLTALIKKAIDNHITLAKARNCGVLFRKPNFSVPLLNIDGSMIGLVIDNLISNAIKYSIGLNGSCKILASLTMDKEYITVSVEDSGIGIPEENHHRIFEKFFRADNAVRLETEGSGLGLYIAKLIVEASGGKIWFTSLEKKGTKFSFTLPLAGSKAYKGDTSLA